MAIVSIFPFFVFSEPLIIATIKIEIIAIPDRVKRLFFTTFRPKKRLWEVAILTKKGQKMALNTQKNGKKRSEQAPLPY